MDKIKVKSFSTEGDAELAKNLLQAYGVPSFIQMNAVHSSGISTDSSGADLFVRAEDAEKAEDLLEAEPEE